MKALRTIAFDEFELDEALQELRRSGLKIPLAPRSYELLHYLIEHRGRVVSKEELLREVWGGVAVTDGAFSAALREVRQALGDDGAAQRWLQTQRKRGYRFLGEVQARAHEGRPSDDLASDGPAGDPESASGPQDGRPLHGNLPALPRILVGRDSDLAAVRERLLAPGAPLCAVHGWPGVGKTTLAAVLSRDEALGERYPDGILWSRLGPDADPHSALQLWARSLGCADLAQQCPSADELAQRLARLVRTRRCLFILDDLWKREDFAALRIGGRDCGTLVTTRLTGIADEIGTGEDRYRLGVLEPARALELLGALVPRALGEDRASCEKLVDLLEGLPLAIHVASGLLKAEMRHGFSVTALLKELTVDERRVYRSPLPSDLAQDASPTVAALIQRSTHSLAPTTQERFAVLGVFVEKPAVFQEDAIRYVWEVEDVRPTVGELVDRGLLEPAGPGTYQMHALLKTHAEALMAAQD